MHLCVHLCFASDPAEWAAFVAEDLRPDEVQLTFGLLDPWTPTPEYTRLARKIRSAADAHDLTLHSTVVGLANYVPGGLLHPDLDAWTCTAIWWQRAVNIAASLSVAAVGGPLGGMSCAQSTDSRPQAQRWQDLTGAVASIADYAHGATGVGILLGSGHTAYEPLYSEQAAFRDRTSALGTTITVVRLDTTDRHGDPPWGWPHEHGTVDAGTAVTGADLTEMPLMLAVFPQFEDDDTVRATMRASVAHCRAAMASAGAAV